ncbi:hypothetical protein PVT71_28660 (plasmid) [Salipiger sp. H15]|uniref:KfrA N-terminal DNA-binding domain-containing protein n=1 Tax=Alloyangia sp. H15 TaxID=3029062 RepID=A0AAU8ASG2_9RHOB
MTRTTARKRQGGRPPSYTSRQVYGIVARLIGCGTPSGEIDAAMVKEELCSAFGISSTIRLESLQKHVDLALSDYDSDEAEALLRALPETVAASIDHFIEGAREAFALLVARQNARCQAEAQTVCEELCAEKRTAHWRISELEAEVDRLKTDRQVLTAERDRTLAEADKLREQIRLGEDELNRLRGANGVVQLLVSQLQKSGLENLLQASVETGSPGKPSAQSA